MTSISSATTRSPFSKRNAAWLKKFKTAKILIEGHCDERGTEDYNLALGEKRAKSAYRLSRFPRHPRRADEDDLLRQEPAPGHGPRRSRLAEEPARPIHGHRKITFAGSMKRALGVLLVPVLRRLRGRPGQGEKDLRADLPGRPAAEAAIPEAGEEARRGVRRTSSSSADQVRDLPGQFKLFQTDQARPRKASKTLPAAVSRSSSRNWARSKPSS